MARGKKTSSEKIVEVLTAKIANPDLSLRDIEKETGVNHQTASDIIENEMDEVLTSSDKKNVLFEHNLSIIAEGARKIELAMKLLNPETIRDTKEYQTIVDTAFKQNLLIEGKPTDNIKQDIRIILPSSIV